MGEIGLTKTLDLPFRLLASRLFEAQRSEDETNCVAVNLHMLSAMNRERRRFLKQSMVVLLTIRADFPHFTLKSAQHSRYLPIEKYHIARASGYTKWKK
jgi:hypothetical protein